MTVLQQPFSQDDPDDAVRRALAADKRKWRIDAKCAEARRRLGELSPKERRVVDLVVQGELNKVIAKRLDMAIRTVESYRHRIFQKTQANSVPELVRLVLLAQRKAME